MASGINAKVSTPEEADDLFLFAFVIIVLGVAVIWVINSLSSAFANIAGAAAAAPGQAAAGVGSGIGSGLGDLGSGVKNFFTNLF